jgi:hypothetical protein
MASKSREPRKLGVELFVIFESGASVSLGVTIFCRASIVDEGGVFSPKIGLGGGLAGRMLDVSFPESLAPEVGVPDLVSERVGLLSGERFSKSKPGVRGNLSGDFSGDRSRVLSASM